MADAARSFLDSLEPDQRRSAHLDFDVEERRRWHYTPQPSRPGLAMGRMGRPQAKAAQRLVASGLSVQSYARVVTIAALEDVLDELEEGSADRHAGDYWLAVFGQPGQGSPWGWRFEGHHVSVNYTVSGEGVAATPLFLGANPAHVLDGETTLLRPLGREEDLALQLLGSLDQRQMARAVYSDEAPSDILTGEEPDVPPALEPRGVAGGELSGSSLEILRALAATFVARLPDELAQPRLAVLDGGGLRDLHFGWAGDVAPRRPHYYRLQGPGLLVELDDTEEGGNHVHTVVRDPDDDFGADVLTSHRLAHHSVN
jgi:hypothetical protein